MRLVGKLFMFPYVAFSEGRKRVNTPWYMSTHGSIGCILTDSKLKKCQLMGTWAKKNNGCQHKITSTYKRFIHKSTAFRKFFWNLLESQTICTSRSQKKFSRFYISSASSFFCKWKISRLKNPTKKGLGCIMQKGVYKGSSTVFTRNPIKTTRLYKF